MHITRLEITGFKSFLEKTRFDFSSHVTGIVGPNGCGKSNVVDAFKWVTGELSFKELRGHSTEDLIFAGSEFRPPTGMAEVTLVLDNHDGSAPAQYKDFAEISVTRRIFRDGSSEFLINKIQSRLRDIVDIFLDTGVGQSSYSIIEQGRVGMIVSSKPEDRRAIIEEAAGIEKFKNRKKAALRKMEYTKQNLQRVADVLGELQRQISSLERQARKAERFKEARTKAQELDVALSARAFTTLEREQRELRERERLASDMASAEQTELTVTESRIEAERLELLEREKTVQRAQQDLFDEGQRISSLESRTEGLKKDAALLRETIDREIARVEGLAQDEKRLDGELQQLTDTIASQEQSKVEIQGLLLEAEAKDSELRSSIQRSETGLEATKTRLIESIAKEAELRNQAQTYRDRIEEIRRQLEIRERELERASLELVELEREYTDRQTELGLVVQLRFGFEREQTQTRDRLGQLQSDRTQETTHLSELRRTTEGSKSRLNALEEFERTYQGYQKGVRVMMERRGQEGAEVGQVRALLGELVRPTRGYEKAVEAVLSERVECLVVESPRDALWAIQFLKGEGQGRASFLPKQLRHGPRQTELPAHSGVLGKLREFVSCDESYRETLDALLSDVILVESLPTALGFWEDGIDSTMVTVEGDLITRQGLIIGGSWGEERGVLQLHSEVEELREAVRRGESEAEVSAAKLSRLEREIAATTTELTRVDRELELTERKAFDNEKDYERLEEAVQRARQSLNVIADEKSRLAVEEVRLQETLASALASLEATVADRAKLDEESSRQQIELDAARRSASEHSVYTTEVKVRQASLLERFEAFVRDQRSKSEQRQFANEERARLVQSSEEHSQGAARLSETIAESERERQSLIQVYQEHQEQVHLLRSEYETRSEEVRIEAEKLKGAHERIRQQLDELSLLRMKLQEEDLRQEHLVTQIREKYAITLQEMINAEGYREITDEEAVTAQQELDEQRQKMAQIGDVNLAAIEEVKEMRERFTFLSAQKLDLETTLESLSTAIRKINATTRDLFIETFNAVNTQFQTLFPKLFRGGKARLELTDPENLLETGVDIIAQPPGKRLQNMNLLSGGEKALTAVALLFSIFQHKAPPFCILDEVDAPLDDMNVRRFRNLVAQMSENTQFILITHNKLTMEISKNLYGVTMEEPGVSRTVSVQVHQETASQVEPAVAEAASVA